MINNEQNVAKLIVRCLESEGVEYVFGIPGEENIYLMDALNDSTIKVIITRHEQGAAFMADIYGHVTGKAGVCFATLGPGALNLPLGVANALLDRHPMVALPAQADLRRINKESHQVIDLIEVFKPISKWTGQLCDAESTEEMVRKSFKVAQADPPGPTTLIVPENIEKSSCNGSPMPVNVPTEEAPHPKQLARATELINKSKSPVILAGGGVYRARASKELLQMAEKLNIPVVTTFLGKGAIPADHKLYMGALGFMVDDYTNFGFENADLVITVGYDLVEYNPAKWNVNCDKDIIHINHEVAEVDKAYSLTVGIEGNIANTLSALADSVQSKPASCSEQFNKVSKSLNDELLSGADDDRFPLNPRRIVSDISKVMRDEDMVVCDTGALKVWMSRLYPCKNPCSLIESNGLSPMGIALPGAIGAKVARPESRVLSVMGDGSFLMNCQEIETAMREKTPIVILVWVDESYGLIEWKQNLAFGRTSFTRFTNPDFVKFAESFGAKGYDIKSAAEFLPTLEKALSDDTVSIIACPVDYSENNLLTDKLLEMAK